MSKHKKNDMEEVHDKENCPDAQRSDTSAEQSGCSDKQATPEQAAPAQNSAALEAEISSLKDQYLRKLADYENFRKRMFREKEDAVKYANSQLLGELVGVIDDFERAIRSSETSADFAALHDGVDMIRKGFVGMLANKYGLTQMESLGAEFDPNIHEAVMIEQGECPHPLVVEEFVKGYKLHDRILRPSKVKVRMPAQQNDSGNDEKPEAEVSEQSAQEKA